MATDYEGHVEEVVEENRYLALSTTDGREPWVAPVEYIFDDGAFYFFSTNAARHAEHIDQDGSVAAAIYGPEQPAYGPDLSAPLNGIQVSGNAWRLARGAYPEAVVAAIDELDPPMPPYEAFAIEPEAVFVPLVEDGVNTRVEVEMDW